jgi:pimeloyl-ACP methyl ester carboxylesterase
MVVPSRKSKPVKKNTLICVHGAWHGSWCWKYLTPALEAAGIQVITPDLPGHQGDLSQMSLDNYIQFIERLICQQTEPVTLLGHSLAGFVITAVANRYPEKIKQLIYLSAFIPKNNQCLMDCVQAHNMPKNLAIELIESENGKVMRLRPKYAKNYFYALCDAVDVQFALEKVCDQVMSTFTTPVSYDTGRIALIPKAYILCTEDVSISEQVQQAMAGCVDAQIHKLKADHSPFFSKIHELAGLIEKIMR